MTTPINRRTPPRIAILTDRVTTRTTGGPVHVTGGEKWMYEDAVNESGGKAVWVADNGSSPENLLKDVDGLVIPGGADLDPRMYGDEPNPHAFLRRAMPQYDRWQKSMLETALKMHLPVLGICRGMQLLNVLQGGTLYQDVIVDRHEPWPSRVDHINGLHAITFKPGSDIAGIFENRERLGVNSSHHQAIRKLGEGLIATAFADDDIVEAVEKIGDPNVMGVQFHPERFTSDFRQRFFGYFIRQAACYHARRVRVAPVPVEAEKASAANGAAPRTAAEAAPPVVATAEARPVESAPAAPAVEPRPLETAPLAAAAAKPKPAIESAAPAAAKPRADEATPGAGDREQGTHPVAAAPPPAERKRSPVVDASATQPGRGPSSVRNAASPVTARASDLYSSKSTYRDNTLLWMAGAAGAIALAAGAALWAASPSTTRTTVHHDPVSAAQTVGAAAQAPLPAAQPSTPTTIPVPAGFPVIASPPLTREQIAKLYATTVSTPADTAELTELRKNLKSYADAAVADAANFGSAYSKLANLGAQLMYYADRGVGTYGGGIVTVERPSYFNGIRVTSKKESGQVVGLSKYDDGTISVDSTSAQGVESTLFVDKSGTLVAVKVGQKEMTVLLKDGAVHEFDTTWDRNTDIKVTPGERELQTVFSKRDPIRTFVDDFYTWPSDTPFDPNLQLTYRHYVDTGEGAEATKTVTTNEVYADGRMASDTVPQE